MRLGPAIMLSIECIISEKSRPNNGVDFDADDDKDEGSLVYSRKRSIADGLRCSDSVSSFFDQRTLQAST